LLWYLSGIYDILLIMSTLLSTIVLNADLGVPYCDQLYAEVKARIIEGKLQPGVAFPPERDLIEVLGISRTTLRRAFGRLETEGFVQRRRGVGSFVADSRHWTKAGVPRVGIMVWDMIQTGLHKELFSQLCTEAATRGVQVQTLHGEEAEAHGASLGTLAAAARIDGLIVMPGVARNRLAPLVDVARPVVVMETHLALQGIDHVLIDSFQGVYDGVRELIRLGHRDIGYVGGLVQTPGPSGFRLVQDSYSRCLAYRSALEDAGLAFRQDRYFELPYEPDLASQWVGQIRKTCPSMTAVVAFSDSLAVNIINACRGRGLKVPGNLSVIGFGNSAAESKAGELATCSYATERMARLGVQRLLERIRHGGIGGVSIAVPSVFKPGASIGPPRSRQTTPRAKRTERT